MRSRFLEQRHFETTEGSPLAENAAALDLCFLRHLLPPDLGAGIRVEEREGGGVEFFGVQYGCASVKAWGVMPSCKVMVALVAEAGAPLRVNGLASVRHSLLVFGEDCPVFIRADSSVTFLACRIDRTLLPMAWREALCASPAEACNFLSVALPEAHARPLAEGLGRLTGLQPPGTAGVSAQAAGPAAQELLSSLPPPSRLPLELRRGPQAARQAALARLLRQDDGAAAELRWAVPELMARLGVRRRTLEYDIQGLTGMSPHAWLTALRLDRVRAGLMRRGAGAGVGDIAARWGFVHQGRFARAYCQRFGELPHRTLSRAARSTREASAAA